MCLLRVLLPGVLLILALGVSLILTLPAGAQVLQRLPSGADYAGALARNGALLALLVGAGWLAWRRGWRGLARERRIGIFRNLFVLFLYLTVSAVVLDAFMSRWGFRGDDAPFGLMQLLERRAHRPFAYRVLSPAIVEGVASRLPAGWVERREEWLRSGTPLLRYRADGESWSTAKALRWHVAYFYLLAVLVAALFVARALVGAALGRAPPLQDLAPALAVLFVPLTLHLGGYLYDFPELLLAFGCALAALQGRFWLFAALYAAAVLNKESSAILAAYFLAVAPLEMPRRRWLPRAAFLLGLGAVLVGGLWWLFREQPGSPLWTPFRLNLLFLLDPRSYALFFDAYAPLVPLPRGWNVAVLFLGAFLVGWRWSEKPAPLRRMLGFTAALNVPLYLLFGLLDETRVLAALYPPLFLLACHTALDVYRPPAAGAAGAET